MKQYITKKQLDELSEEEELKLYDIFNIKVKPWLWKQIIMAITIGQMIEFLGGDIWRIEQDGTWKVCECDDDGEEFIMGSGEELCDALWEAVKYKLKQ